MADLTVRLRRAGKRSPAISEGLFEFQSDMTEGIVRPFEANSPPKRKSRSSAVRE